MRRQRTIAREATVTGIGLFRGNDVKLRLLPAAEDHGIAFQRTDVVGAAVIPAIIDYAVKQPRRTAIAHAGVRVETIEHLMAALAGLQVDNCLVQLNAPEPPAGDGSAQLFADAILEAGIVEQSAIRPCLTVTNKATVFSLDRPEDIQAVPSNNGQYTLTYDLVYGHPHIPPQTATVDVTPQSFLDAISFARTFVLEEEVEALRAQGFGLRMTTQNLLVFGPHGPVDNAMHTPDECARHKLLDCLGDLALIGCDLRGDIHARRSGHHHNRELVRDLLVTHPHMRSVIHKHNRALEMPLAQNVPRRMVS
ncbi:MAG: UDP-3-O-acyl-N-acetylglucosamine deacetylase [Planctomycetaceae bacterium]|nr:UDP-3-O-acyl-N-acetylglucosamine deacetylase [Planctomycetaceae bacterium]